MAALIKSATEYVKLYEKAIANKRDYDRRSYEGEGVFLLSNS
jgi:hypothetical protein